MTKKAVDKDLKRFVQLERATLSVGRRNINLGLGLLFLVAVWIFASFHHTGAEGSIVLIVAAVIGGYMALNIGANDVANNVGPAVGSKAITLVGALIIAAIFEAAGAIIAGGDVVTTISKNIIDTEAVASKSVFIWAMMAALLSAALWVNLATWIGAPVSTTHSIVGGVMGAGITSAGFSAVNWFVMGKIAASWVISPIMGGAIAASFLAFVTYFVLYKEDKIVGHIFVHKHMLGKHPVYERCTLWVKNDYRKYHLGLLLMHELTIRFKDDYLVSIAKPPIVHMYNEFLGMGHVTLSQLSSDMIDTLEQIGKLRDEERYKYYVNARFFKAIKRLK